MNNRKRYDRIYGRNRQSVFWGKLLGLVGVDMRSKIRDMVMNPVHDVSAWSLVYNQLVDDHE